PPHGVLECTGGTIEVKGGVFDPPGSTLDLADGSRHVILSNGAFASFGNSPYNAYALIVGETGGGGFDILSGSTLSTSATTAVGLNAGSTGTMRVEGVGSTWNGTTIS